jgi:PAS domain S-box-containing protein
LATTTSVALAVAVVVVALLARAATHRKRAESALKASEEKLRTVVDQASEAILVLQEEKIVFANAYALGLFEAAWEAVAAAHFLDFTHPADRDLILERYQRRMRGEEVSGAVTYRVLTAQGRTIWVEGNANLITWQGRPASLVFVRDISERRRAEEAQALEAARLEALLKLGQMTEATLPEIAAFALEEGVRLTGSTIGYLAFANADETVLTMHAWSSQAMRDCAVADRPITYAVKGAGLWVEPLRQRRPVIVNDYQASHPWKKGLPPGHVGLTRHLGVPVLDGERVVIVAGVGNKPSAYDETRSEESRVGKECRRLCRSRWSPYH